MKGQAWAYAFVAFTLIVTSLFLLRLNLGTNVERSVVTVEGKLLSFSNQAELLLKSFDQSVYFISQRAAYDLGKNGGLEYGNYWTSDYPKMDTLEEELLERIKDNLPVSYEKENINVIMGEEDIEIKDFDSAACGSIDDSKCFYVRGNKFISFYDSTIDARISVYHDIDSKIDSNYFKLLNAGRAIMEDTKYSDHLDDHGMLRNVLNSAKNPLSPSFDSRMENLYFFTSLVIPPNIVEVTIEEHCYPISFYCIAPLKYGEIGMNDVAGNPVPYDYVKLIFRYDKEQTGFTDPTFDFSLLISSPGDEVVCS